jgi:hypothetical protein
MSLCAAICRDNGAKLHLKGKRGKNLSPLLPFLQPLFFIPTHTNYGRTASCSVPHIANIVALVDLPFGKGQKFLSSNGVLDKFVGGWTASFTGSYSNGALALLNAPYTYPQWGFEYGRKRVNLVSGKPIRTNVSRQDLDPRDLTKRWWTTDFLTIPGTFELGNAPLYINQLRDPNVYSDNMGFIKRTCITETVNIKLRGEFFNIFNRTNFGIGGTPIRPNVVDTNPTTGRFGVAAGPRSGPRTGQMALKINF